MKKLLFCLRRPGGTLFVNIFKKHAKKTCFWDDARKERHLADREWVGGATPLFVRTAPPGPRVASAKNFSLKVVSTVIRYFIFSIALSLLLPTTYYLLPTTYLLREISD